MASYDPDYSPKVPDWHKEARCADSRLSGYFFERALWPTAKDICSSCPVIFTCRNEMFDDEWAVVGGLDPEERRKMKKGSTLSSPPSS